MQNDHNALFRVRHELSSMEKKKGNQPLGVFSFKIAETGDLMKGHLTFSFHPAVIKWKPFDAVEL